MIDCVKTTTIRLDYILVKKVCLYLIFMVVKFPRNQSVPLFGSCHMYNVFLSGFGRSCSETLDDKINGYKFRKTCIRISSAFVPK